MIYNPPGNPPFRLPTSRGNLRNWNLARRPGGQVVTNLVCGRPFPDPLGVVPWYGKLEFGGFAELTIDN